MTALKIGTGTGVKWAQLEDEELPAEIKNRRRGGAKNPHGRTISLCVRYLSGRLTAAEVRTIIKAIPDKRKRELTGEAFEGLVQLYPQPFSTSVKPRASTPFDGPLKLLKVGTKPHLVVRDGSYQTYIFIWANLTPVLLPSGAYAGALLIRESCETQPGVFNTFEVADVRQRVLYSFPADELDADANSLNTLLKRIETQVAKEP